MLTSASRKYDPSNNNNVLQSEPLLLSPDLDSVVCLAHRRHRQSRAEHSSVHMYYMLPSQGDLLEQVKNAAFGLDIDELIWSCRTHAPHSLASQINFPTNQKSESEIVSFRIGSVAMIQIWFCITRDVDEMNHFTNAVSPEFGFYFFIFQ